MERSEILANFQACTGIDDIGQCITALEATNWNLEEAVNGSLGQNFSQVVQPSIPTSMVETQVTGISCGPVQIHSPEVEFSDASPMTMTDPTNNSNQPSSRMIKFLVTLGDTTKTIELDETATLDVFYDVVSIELGIPRTDLNLQGWPDSVSAITSLTTSFMFLNLPNELNLTVNLTNDQELSELNKTYRIKVHDIKNNKIVDITVTGSQLISDMKAKVASETRISESKQVWSGINASDATCTIASLHLDEPIHSCTVRPSLTPLSGSDDDDSNDDELDFGDTADDDNSLYFTEDSATSSSQRLLMPEQAHDDIIATRQFNQEFGSRFGDCPQFAVSSLENACQEAFGTSARDRKLLTVYLHHDKSIQSNVFCSEILCKPMVLDFLAANCVTWGWDMTHDFNKAKFLTIGGRILGRGTASTIERVRKDEYPVLIIVEGRGRSAKVTASIIQGHDTLDEMMSKLIHANEEAKANCMEDLAVEMESEAREQVKREQEEAYQMSLMQDMEKQRILDAEKEEQGRIEKAIRQEAEDRLKRIEQLQNEIPEEPTTLCKEEVSTIKFNPPDGSSAFKRKFLAKEKLEILLLFVESKGYTRDRYRVLSAWPKRDISGLNQSSTLKELKLFPQESLIIEERT